MTSFMKDARAGASVTSHFDSSSSLVRLFCLRMSPGSVGDETDPSDLPVSLGLSHTLFLMSGTLFPLLLILWVSAQMSFCPGKLS